MDLWRPLQDGCFYSCIFWMGGWFETGSYPWMGSIIIRVRLGSGWRGLKVRSQTLTQLFSVIGGLCVLLPWSRNVAGCWLLEPYRKSSKKTDKQTNSARNHDNSGVWYCCAPSPPLDTAILSRLTVKGRLWSYEVLNPLTPLDTTVLSRLTVERRIWS